MYLIKKRLVPNFGTRGKYKPIAIVNHITIGNKQSVINTFMNPGGNSSHFLVCRDGEILQLVELTQRAHTNGYVRSPKSPLVRQMGNVNANYYTVTKEHEGYGDQGGDGSLTEEQFYASVWLDKWIQQEVEKIYGNRIALNSHQVIAHNQIDSQKGTCPGINFPWARVYAEHAFSDRVDFPSYERRLTYLQGNAAKRSVAYAIAERLDELGRQLSDPTLSPVAREMIELLRPVMPQAGWMLVDGVPDISTEGIVKRGLNLYRTSLGAGKFSDEADRKLLLFDAPWREKGLLV